MPAARTIIHIDMDAFFAAIEQLDHPELRGRPVLVGYEGNRGVVAAASYESRPFGCHSAQPMAIARRRCPHAIVVPVRGRRYRGVSAKMFAILDSFAPCVEPLSIDEAFLDITGCDRLLGPPAAVAERLRNRIRHELQLTASVGVAPNKFLAKLASEMNKPDGVTVIPPDRVDEYLLPLPVGSIPGIGPVAAEKLGRLGIRIVGDLRNQSLEWLAQWFGRDAAERYDRLARGVDDRPVTPDSAARSIGHEQTFEWDMEDVSEVRRVLLGQVEQVARRLRKQGLRGRTVSLKIRFGDFQTISRSMTLDPPDGPTDSTHVLWRAARALFDRWAGEAFVPVRLIGVHASHLSKGGQLDLFADPRADRDRRIDQTADAIVERFGKAAIRRAGAME